MKSCCDTTPEIVVRRLRPALGTYVEVSATSTADNFATAQLARAVDRAYAAIAAVESQLSVFRESSDVARLNRLPAGRALRVGLDAWRVLSFARRLSELCGGVFDITTARCGGWKSILPNADGTVTKTADVEINLGGIGKGYAVDRAIDALRAAGVASGHVNGGGDIAVFGAAQPIQVRHPTNLERCIVVGQLADGAVATSANYFDHRGRERVQMTFGTDRNRAASVTVVAPTCQAADALTKVVAAVSSARALEILSKYEASAMILRADEMIRLAPDPSMQHAA